jgi:hypothetical protein
MAGTKTKTVGKKVRYSYCFAAREHWHITKLSQLKGWSQNVLGLFIPDGKGLQSIGGGELRLINLKRKYVHTDGVGLNNDMRRKGHGIHLYFALIRAAKNIGASRIYSSKSLNNFSGNMWCNKLREFFDVQGPKAKKSCSCKCRRCRRQWGRYYIDLTKISLRSIPR